MYQESQLIVRPASAIVDGRSFRGLAVSDRIALSPSSHSGSPAKSLAALLLGLITPDAVVPDHPERDPSLHGLAPDWARLQQEIRMHWGAGGGGAGLRSTAVSPLTSTGPQAGTSGGRRPQRTVLAQGTPLQIMRPPSKYFDPPELLVVVERSDILDHWGLCEQDGPREQDGLSPRSSPALSDTSLSISPDSNEDETPLTPAFFLGDTAKGFFGTMELQIQGAFNNGELAASSHGTLCAPGANWQRDVVVKCYDTLGRHTLIMEAWAYHKLEGLQGAQVPAQIALVAPPHWGWVGLLMENAGTGLECGDDWRGLDSEPGLQRAIYAALAEIHQGGVQHGDVAPRNVVRRPNGDLAFIDFGLATAHDCPGGDSCHELRQLREQLEPRQFQSSNPLLLKDQEKREEQ
ncbi:hypothetical protein DFH09DRAFT_195007 [Mycena vulgaris]|nr:hypothetical protein DFH09DRAFT_195007 [Mycena vulgaris]